MPFAAIARGLSPHGPEFAVVLKPLLVVVKPVLADPVDVSESARLRRDQEIDAAVTARNLARIRRNNASATSPARQPRESIVHFPSSEQLKRKANISDPANEADDEKEDEEEDDEDWL